MDILTLQLSMEELHVNQSGKSQQASKFMMKDFMVSQMQHLHNSENLNQSLTAMRGEASSYGFNLYSSPAYDVISSDRSAFAIPPPSSAYRTLTQDNTQVKPEDTHGCIDGSLCTTVNDREGSRTSELCLETSLQQCTSLSTLTPVPVEHNSSEEELWRINWNSQLIAPHASNSSEEEELCEEVIIGRPRPSSSGRFFPAAVTSDVNPVKLPVSRRISDTSFKRKAFLISSNCDSSAVILRPNLDFDKMRKTSYLQRQGGNNDVKRPRLVRIRGFKDPLNCVRSLQRKFCPSVTAFNSLSLKSGIK